MSLTADQLARIALDAGKLIMDIYSTDFDVERKDDASPVTEADAKAEALILQGLKAADPDLEVVAEESASAGHVPDHGARFALVDPLDGTKEFINRNGQFTVNIGIIEHGRPVMGVVYAPAKNRLFVAESHNSGWQAEAAPGADVPTERQKLRIRACPEAGVTAIASRSGSFAARVAVSDRSSRAAGVAASVRSVVSVRIVIVAGAAALLIRLRVTRAAPRSQSIANRGLSAFAPNMATPPSAPAR